MEALSQFRLLSAMDLEEPMEKTIPVFPCRKLAETLDFYRVLGFTVTHEQMEPYLYGAVQRGAVELHFARFKGAGAVQGNSVCLVMVPEVAAYHRAFAEGLRRRYGRIPTAGSPRITRLQPGQTRFHLYDPEGNVLIFIDQNEPDVSYEQGEETRSPLAAALENAAFLRDTYTNDASAARVLDKALARHAGAEPLERALALAARAELAVALGDGQRARVLLAEIEAMPLSAEDRARHRTELEAASRLAQWLGADEGMTR